MTAIVYGFTLTEPWASLVRLRLKQWETRSFAPFFQRVPAEGLDLNIPFVVHSSAKMPTSAKLTCQTEPFLSDLAHAGLSVETLPLGMILAYARITRVERITHETATMISDREYAYGNYSLSSGPRYMWQIEDVRPLETPIRARGALGLWKWDADAPPYEPAVPQRKPAKVVSPPRLFVPSTVVMRPTASRQFVQAALFEEYP